MELNDHRFIRMVRHLRGLTLVEFGEVMKVSEKTLSKLEAGFLPFSELYQERFNAAVRELNVSNIEKLGLKILLEEKGRYKNVK